MGICQPSWSEQFDALRYMSVLSNLRTIIAIALQNHCPALQIASESTNFMIIVSTVACDDGFRPTYVGGRPRICNLPREQDPNGFEQSEERNATSSLIKYPPN